MKVISVVALLWLGILWLDLNAFLFTTYPSPRVYMRQEGQLSSLCLVLENESNFVKVGAGNLI